MFRTTTGLLAVLVIAFASPLSAQTIFYQVQNGDVFVFGNGVINTVEMERNLNRDDELRVHADGQTGVFQGVRSIRIFMNGSFNSTMVKDLPNIAGGLVYTGSRHTDIVSISVAKSLTSGRATVDTWIGGDLYVDLGQASDIFANYGQGTVGDLKVMGNITIHTNTGGNIVDIANVTCLGARVGVYALAAGSQITVAPKYVLGDLTLRGWDGDDTLSAIGDLNATVVGQVGLYGWGGNDTLIARDIDAGRLFVGGHDGSDRFEASGMKVSRLTQVSLGTDVFSRDAEYVTMERCELDGEARILGSDGREEIELIRCTNRDLLRVVGRDGIDVVSMKAHIGIGDVAVELGDGFLDWLYVDSCILLNQWNFDGGAGFDFAEKTTSYLANSSGSSAIRFESSNF